MFFISKRKFEEKVAVEVGRAMDERNNWERYDRLSERFRNLEQRVSRLENLRVKGECNCSEGDVLEPKF